MSSLPVLKVPVYEVTLPSDGRKIKIRPFTVKEEKLFLLVRESKELKDVIETVKQVIRNCVVEPADIEPDDLPIIDVEMLFVHLRARSKGEVIDLEFECNNDSMNIDGVPLKCGAKTKLSFNLLDAQLEHSSKEHSPKIEITSTIGLKMKYPTFGLADILGKNVKDAGFEAIIGCIDYIYDEDKMYRPKDMPKEEVTAWFDDVQKSTFDKISLFFDELPSVVNKATFKCAKCGHSEEVKLKGIADFFS